MDKDKEDELNKSKSIFRKILSEETNINDKIEIILLLCLFANDTFPNIYDKLIDTDN